MSSLATSFPQKLGTGLVVYLLGIRLRFPENPEAFCSASTLCFLEDPDVPVVRLVLDNLNTHRMVSLYETVPAPEARCIANRLEFSPHAQARELAEVEFSGLARACLKGANPDEDALHKNISAL